MYAVKHYMYLHKQDCELSGWPTLQSMCICRLYMCVLHCVCVSVCPCVHHGNCLAPVVF